MRNQLSRSAVVLAFALLCTAGSLRASLPAHPNHHVKYINPDNTVTYYYVGSEYYVKDVIPNEWYPSWSAATLQAAAVIVRSGTYWRINRSYLNYNSYPHNNCYQGTTVLSDGSTFKYYRTAPQTKGGDEQFIPNSNVGQTATNSATDATRGIHADRVSIPSGRPDAFVPHRYNSTIQNRTSTCAGTYFEKIRCAYLNYGSPYDPNAECSQTDDLTSTDPRYTTN